jgi:hypothetical protein
VANNKEHLERIRMTVEHLHKCRAMHVATLPVHEVFQGQTVWKGDVEEFALSGHPKAQKAYGWSEGTGDKERFFAVLEIPPLKSAADAVRASIVADVKKRKL